MAELLQTGLALHQQGRLTEARPIYQAVLAQSPEHFEALHLLGVIAGQTQDFEAAVAFFGQAIAIDPSHAHVHNNLGNALKELTQRVAAIASYDTAISLRPNYPEAYKNRGNALRELSRFTEALASYDEAISRKPDYADAYSNRGTALRGLKRLDEALASYDEAIELKPDYAAAYNNRAHTLIGLGQLALAISSYDTAISLGLESPETYNNRGNALRELGRLDEALASYDKAIKLKPDYADAYSNRGQALRDLKQVDAAIASYDKAISLKPDSPDAYNSRGNALREFKRLDEALASYDKAIALKPDYGFLLGSRLHTQMQMCDWQGFSERLSAVESQVRSGATVSSGFPLLAACDSPMLHKLASEIWVKTKAPQNSALGVIARRVPRQKIRVAYYSADFGEHPVSFLLAQLFESHNKDRFETIAISFGTDTQSQTHKRVAKAFDEWVDVRSKSDQAVAQLSRDLGVDIAIDLGGVTAGARMGIFSYRAAPIQASYIGYLGTTGAPYIDYLLADRVIVPQSQHRFYTEKILHLPSYQANDSTRVISDKTFSRQELGLPEDAFVFCCFNNNYKITPDTFSRWMRILKATDNSVLLLYADNSHAPTHLKRQAQMRGVAPERLVFAKRLPRDEYLARYKAADLFLDTSPYNAGTTASDALWAGLPVLTLMGESFASRVAASLLTAIDLPELIASSPQQYEAIALELASHPQKLALIKHRLAENRLTQALFDTPRFARGLEAAYEAMYDRYQAGLAPDHIYIGM